MNIKLIILTIAECMAVLAGCIAYLKKRYMPWDDIVVPIIAGMIGCAIGLFIARIAGVL